MVPVLGAVAPPAAHAVGETISVADVSAVETNGDAAEVTFVVKLSQPATGQVSVDYATANRTSGGQKAKSTATANDGDEADYQAKSGTLTFSQGQQSKAIAVPIHGDATPEPNEEFLFNLSNPLGGLIGDGQATGTIQNDDGAPATVTVINKVLAEGNTGTSNFGGSVITLNKKIDQPVTVTFTTSNGSATTADADYVAKTATAVIPANELQVDAPVVVNGDGKVEPNETFSITASNPDNANIGGAAGIQTIQNDDGTPAISVAGPTGDVSEKGPALGGTSTADFTVSLSKTSATNVIVDYATQNGTAVAPGDYTAKTGTLTFTPGQTSKTVSVTVNDDTTQELKETFSFVLSNPVNGSIASPGNTASANIVDDETQPTVSVADKSVTEGTGGVSKLEFTVTLSAASGAQTTVQYSTADDARSGAVPATAVNASNPNQTNGDYTPVAPTTLTFAPGETTKTAEVSVVTDANDDAAAETLLVNLANASGLTVADGQGVGTINDDDATPTLSIVSPGPVTEQGDGTNVITNPPFHIALSHISNLPISVSYATVAETATEGNDFGGFGGSLSFPVGSLRPLTNTCDATTAPDACLPVTVFGDNISETNETLAMHLSNPVNALAGPDGRLTINDTPDPVPSVSVANAGNVTETNSGTTNASFTVSLSTVSGQVTRVNYATSDGTAKQPGDYASTTGTLQFNAGETSKDVLVPVNGDGLSEPNETFTLTLSAPQALTLGTSTGSATILNDDGAAATLSIGNATVTEGTGGLKNAAFVVTKSGTPGQAVTVDYATADGSATQPADYTATTGTLTFAAADTTKTINVPVATDSVTEATETFSVNLTNAINAALGTSSGTGTITDDDAAPVVSIASTSVSEGDTGTTPANFSVTLDHASSTPVTVQAATGGGTASADGDYQTTSGTVTFSPGQTSKTFPVLVNGDTTVEPDETFNVTLTSPSGATLAGGGGSTGTATITDDDTLPTLAAADVTVAEGTGGTSNAVVTVTRTGSTSKVATVDYATAEGTAGAADFTAASGTLTFAVGDASETITVAVNPDSLDENDEGFTVSLTNPSQATISDNSAAVTITDDDTTAPAGTLSVADTTVDENAGVATVTVTLSSPAASNVTVNYATSNGTAVSPGDYTTTNGTLTFVPGDVTESFDVAIANDNLDEFNEKLNVTLSSPSGATVSDGTGAVTIVDEDATPTASISDASVVEGNSGTKVITFTVSLSAASGRRVTVSFATANGTAVSGSDYVARSGSVAFTPGQTTKTITVSVNGDTAVEPNETFRVNLTSPMNVVLADAQGIGTIVNND